MGRRGGDGEEKSKKTAKKKATSKKRIERSAGKVKRVISTIEIGSSDDGDLVDSAFSPSNTLPVPSKKDSFQRRREEIRRQEKGKRRRVMKGIQEEEEERDIDCRNYDMGETTALTSSTSKGQEHGELNGHGRSVVVRSGRGTERGRDSVGEGNRVRKGLKYEKIGDMEKGERGWRVSEEGTAGGDGLSKFGKWGFKGRSGAN